MSAAGMDLRALTPMAENFTGQALRLRQSVAGHDPLPEEGHATCHRHVTVSALLWYMFAIEGTTHTIDWA